MGLLAVRLVVLVVAIQVGRSAAPTDDLARFQAIHDARGEPYRDFVVEYAPVEVIAVRTLLSSDPAATAERVAVLAFAADLGTWWAIRVAWGRRAAERYLWLGAPLLVFIYTRFDLIPVFLATLGVTLAVRRRERLGGASLAVACLAKLWPVVILPGLLVAGMRRAFAWALGVAVVLTGAWWWFGGWRAIDDVLSFRHAAGWEVESLIGTGVWVATGGPIRTEAGAPRIGSVPTAASVGLLILLGVLLTSIWVTAWRRGSAAFGGGAASAVAALLACSSVFSLQYAAWLLPWGAIAWAEGDRRRFALIAGIEVLTGVLFVVYAPDRAALAQALLVARGLLVLAVPVTWLVRGQSANEVASSDGDVTGARQTKRSQT
jgi:hypothetical protein